MSLIESTSPPIGYRLIDPCARCGRAEGVFSLPWPDLAKDAFFLLCGRCLWRKFHDVPKGPVRRELIRQAFPRRADRASL